MNHLTTDQIIEFVSFDDMKPHTMALAATVNGHIRRCPKCLRLVRAFQMVHDEFSALSRDGDFGKYLSLPEVEEKLSAQIKQADR